MTYYSYPPTNSSGGAGIPTYPAFADFPSPVTAGNGSLAIALDTDTLYISDGTNWHAIASPSTVLDIGAFDSGTASANGAHIDGNSLIMQSASATNPGEVNLGPQTFAGDKTFNGLISAENLTGQNSGDTAVVFRPGGIQGGLVYNDWNDLYGAIVTLDIAAVDVCFDDSLGSILIPAGTYNLINVTFQAPLGRGVNTPIVVNLDDGCIFTNFPAVQNLIQLVSQSTTPVFTLPLTPTEYTVFLQLAGKLSSVSGAPLISVPAGITLDLALSTKSTAEGVAGFPLIELGAGASLTVLLGTDSVFSKDLVSGDASTSILIIVGAASGTFNQSQAAFSGTFSVQYEPTITNIKTGIGLGDMVYSSANAVGTVLTANTSTNKMFLSETGTGSLGNAPVWSAISATDMPAFTGDVTTTAGSTATTVAKIQAKTVSGTTGTVNVVFSNSPTLVTPVLGAASGTSLSLSGQLTSTLATGTAPFVVASTTQVANLNVATSGNFTGSLSGNVTGTQGATVLSATTNGTLTSLTALTTAASLATVGTVATGTWNATTIAVNHGGTGLVSGTSGGILGFTGSTTIASSTALTVSQLIIGGGAGATPSTLAAGTANQYLKMNSTPIPAWFTIASPTVQKFTSGSGTYTTPANVIWVQVRMLGGGGGGAGGCNTGGSFSSSGGAGGNTTFGSSFLVANGGGGGVWNGQPSSGGTASIAAGASGTALQGGSSTSGQSIIGSINNALGGAGAASPLGGAGGSGYANAVGIAAIANSGAGGGGGGTGTTGAGNNVAGGGGASGGFTIAIIPSILSATYSYAVGAAGTAGTAGTVGSFAGGAGGSGYIEVIEHYV